MKKVTKNKTFLFFLLGLIILLFIIPNTITATDFHITDTEVQTSSGFKYSANSELPIEGIYHMDKNAATVLWALGKRPDMVRISLKSPTGDTKYVINMEGGAYGFTDTDFIIELKDVDLKVPSGFAGIGSPAMGAWRVEITWYHNIWGPIENNFAKFSTSYIVGESGIMDNIMAPIYIHYDTIPIVQKDDVNIALPGIFFLSMPVWMIAVSLLLLMYIKSSYKIGMHLFKRQIGGTKNVKKTNK